MGLFDFFKKADKFGEKQFNAKTQEMTNMLFTSGVRAETEEERRKLDVLRKTLSMYAYPEDGKPEEMKEIDLTIGEYLKKIGYALQRRETRKVFCYADIVIDLIQNSRRYGTKGYTDEEMKNKDVLTELNCKLDKLYEDKEANEKTMEKLLEEAMTLTGAARERKKFEYNNKFSENKTIDLALTETLKAYNANVRMTNDISRSKIYDELPFIMNPTEYREFAKQAIRKKLAFDERMEQYDNTATEMDSVFQPEADRNAVNSDFDDRLSEKEKMKDMEKIGKAQVDPFEDAIRKKQNSDNK